jgi:hypothetical protein
MISRAAAMHPRPRGVRRTSFARPSAGSGACMSETTVLEPVLRAAEAGEARWHVGRPRRPAGSRG